MKVEFTCRPIPVAQLKELSQTEDVGFDDMGRAQLLLRVEEPIIEGRHLTRTVYWPGGEPLWGSRVSFDPANPPLAVWQTCWSQFSYVTHDPQGRRWTYYGARNGFLAQILRPPFEAVEIVEVAGHYGQRQGSDALKRYTDCAAYYGPRIERILRDHLVAHQAEDDGVPEPTPELTRHAAAEIFRLLGRIPRVQARLGAMEMPEEREAAACATS